MPRGWVGRAQGAPRAFRRGITAARACPRPGASPGWRGSFSGFPHGEVHNPPTFTAIQKGGKSGRGSRPARSARPGPMALRPGVSRGRARARARNRGPLNRGGSPAGSRKTQVTGPAAAGAGCLILLKSGQKKKPGGNRASIRRNAAAVFTGSVYHTLALCVQPGRFRREQTAKAAFPFWVRFRTT